MLVKFAKYVPKLIDDIEGRNHPWTKGGNGPAKLFNIYIYIYMCVCVLILAILFNKITIFPFIDLYKRNAVVTNFFTTFL